MSELKPSEMAKVPDPEVNIAESTTYTDPEAERSYVRKIDFIVLPTLCLVNLSTYRLGYWGSLLTLRLVSSLRCTSLTVWIGYVLI